MTQKMKDMTMLIKRLSEAPEKLPKIKKGIMMSTAMRDKKMPR